MYERFTDRARKVMQLANQEAQRFNHEYIGTEHILLGLIQEGGGVAAHVLRKNLGIDLCKARNEIEKIVQAGTAMVAPGKRPQTPRAKKLIEYAIEEARMLDHNYVGTEHLLLGLLRETEGVAAQVMMNMGLKLDRAREEILNLLRPSAQSSERPEQGPTVGMVEAANKLVEELNKIDAARSAKISAAKLAVAADQLSAGQDARIKALERQLVTVRFLLGGMLGAGSGFVFGERFGLAVGLLTGCCVALFGRLVPALVAGGIAGGLIGSGQLGGDVGALAGAVVGATLASCIVEVGRERTSCGLRKGEAPPPAPSTPTVGVLTRDLEKFLQGMFAGPAWLKFREGRKSELTFADACRFWGITENMTADALDTCLERVRIELTGVEVRLGPNGAVLIDGRSVSAEDIGSLLHTHEFLQMRFSRHLKLLRSRGGKA
jgi:hypothetical protein